MVHELITHTILTKDRQALARIIADAAALADWQALDFCDDRDVCRCDRTGSNDEPTRTQQTRNHPMPQALHRSRNLRQSPTPRNELIGPHHSRLTNIVSIERFHQTLKRWLNPRPRPTDLTDMQTQLDTFRGIYNTERTHRAPHALPLHRPTPRLPNTSHPASNPPSTSTSATTPSVTAANSPSATPADSITSASAASTPAPKSSSWSPPPSPS